MVVPAVMPPTIPVPAPTVPTGGLLLLHVPAPPDAVASVNVIVRPVHTVAGPLIVPPIGDTLTVTFVVVVAIPQNALVSVKVIVVIPGLIPPTIPVAVPIVPIPGLLLLQVPAPPEAVLLLNVIVEPTHTLLNPLIVPATGEVFTVTM